MALFKSVAVPLNMSVIRALVPFSANFASCMFGLKNKIDPFYISWLLTYRCNCRCSHCDWVWTKTDPSQLRQELSSEQRLDLASQIAASRTWGVSISGGEPLLDPVLIPILEKLKCTKKNVNICTNGVLLEKFATTLVNLVSTITISFDSHVAEIHDMIRGVSGTFDRAMKGLEAIKAIRGDNKNPRLVVKGVLFPATVNKLPEYVAFFKKFADVVSLQPVQHNFGHQVHDTTLLFKKEDEDTFRKAIETVIAQFPEFDNPYYQDMGTYLFHPEILLEKQRYRCIFSSSMYLGIDPYGNTGGCLERLASGNIKEQTLREIWQSEKCLSDQKELRRYSRSCICWNYGHILDSYLLPLYNFFHPAP